MHDIEPYYHWLNDYNSAEDVNSPFYNREYSEFYFANTIYNYYIHPLWDDFGSNTLYLKILYADYSEGFAILEFIGEWNDALGNDIMFLKREVIDALFEKDITKFICIGENILNFHYSDESYYEEMYEDLSDEGGWLVFLGLQQHIIDEMNKIRLYNYMLYGQRWNQINWRKYNPLDLYELINEYIEKPKRIN